jgi:hypothetical protein
VKLLNENGIQMTDEEDLTTANEKFLGKLVREKVANILLILNIKLNFRFEAIKNFKFILNESI